MVCYGKVCFGAESFPKASSVQKLMSRLLISFDFCFVLKSKGKKVLVERSAGMWMIGTDRHITGSPERCLVDLLKVLSICEESWNKSAA